MFSAPLRENLEGMVWELEHMRDCFMEYGRTPRGNGAFLVERTNASVQRFNVYQLELLRRIDSDQLSLRDSELYLGLLAFGRDVVNLFSLITL